MPKPSTGARYYAGPFDVVEFTDPATGLVVVVRHGEPIPDHVDVSALNLSDDWHTSKPKPRDEGTPVVESAPDAAPLRPPVSPA